MSGLFYVPTTVFMKMSVGLSLLRYTSDRTHRWTIYIVSTSFTLVGISYFFFLMFQCKPVSYWWDIMHSTHGRCLPVGVILGVNYAVTSANAAADLVYAVIPILIVRNSLMDVYTRVVTVCLLGLGSV